MILNNYSLDAYMYAICSDKRDNFQIENDLSYLCSWVHVLGRF